MTGAAFPVSVLPSTGACGRTEPEWLRHLADIGAAHGFFDRIGRDHMVLFIQEGDTLLVSFDEAPRVYAEAADGLPLGFEAARRCDWSLLSLQSRKRTGFRDADLFAFFDALRTDGFFDSFKRVLFAGFGPVCGHAACAFSTVSPGAHVLASAPAADLGPAYGSFDARFRALRVRDHSRFADAPAALAQAATAALLFDPMDPLSAAHAAQFRAGNITRLPVRFAGADLHRMLRDAGLIVPLLRRLVGGTLDLQALADLLRPARRESEGYLLRLAHVALDAEHPDRAFRIALHGLRVSEAPAFNEVILDVRHATAAEHRQPQEASVAS